MSAPAQDSPTLATVVATVNGTDITLAHVLNARRNLPDQYRELPDAVLFEGLIDQLVQQTLLADAAGDTPTWVTSSAENEERQLMAGIEVDRVADAAISETALEAAYAERFSGAEEEVEFDASHILVDTQDQAQELVTALEGGADFATLARENSTGPSGPSGGALGWFGRGQMVAPFEEAVVEMEVGGISAPVQTQFGWHVIKLNDSRVKERPTLDQLRDELSASIQQAAVTTRLAALQADADITRNDGDIDASVLSTLPLFASE